MKADLTMRLGPSGIIDRCRCYLGRISQAMLVIVYVSAATATNASARELPAGVMPGSEIEQQIERVKSNAVLSEIDKANIVELLQRAIARNLTATEALTQADDYAQALQEAASRQAIFEAQTVNVAPADLPETRLNAPLSDLEARVAREETALTALRKRRAQIDEDLRAEKAFDIQARLEEARQGAPADSLPIGDADERQRAQSALAAATRYMQQARIEMLEQRLLSRSARLSLGEVELRLLSKQIAAAETRLVQLRSLVTDHRQSDANRTLEQMTGVLASLSGEPFIVREIGLDLVSRAGQLVELVTKHDAIIREKESINRDGHRLEQKYAHLPEQLEIAQLDSSPEFGAALRKQRDQLTGIDHSRRKLKEHEQALTQGRLAQFQLDELRESNREIDVEGIVVELRLDPEISVTPEREQVVQKLLGERDRILEKLSSAYASYIEDLTSLTSASRAFIAKNIQYADLLDQHLIWMPSTHAIGLNSLVELGKSMKWLVTSTTWTGRIDIALERIMSSPIVVLFVGLGLFFLLRRRAMLIAALTAMKNRVGRVNRDKLALTLRALLITFLLALPGPLAMLSLAGLIDRSGGLSDGIAAALVYGSMVYLILEFAFQSVRKEGLGELHFQWSAATLNALKRNLPWFMALFIPAVVLNLFIETQGTAPVRDSLGRAAFVIATLMLAMFAYRVLDPERGIWQAAQSGTSARNNWQTRYVAFPLVVLLPLLVAGLSIYGYHYTAVQLDAFFLKSLLVVFVGILIFCLAQRALAISERRLALNRVRAKRAAALAQSENLEPAAAGGEGLPTELDLQEIDLQTISTQTRELLKVAVVIAVGLALWNVWSALLPAFKPLEGVALWQIFESVDGVSIATAVTVWDLMLAIMVGGFTFLATKNIPSLLEVALLSRMSLEAGTSYAVTTIVRYFIVISGSVAVLQLLGAQWSKLQWLIAALSVGLGFGLQEIVANFVSGIVILFERPIRIGDTITVGDQSGTVSRIRIRATTIVDWDRREVVIPNKTFITDRLVNWTLSDPIMRTIIKVGVAYGSDVDRTEKLLLEIAQANARVISDPPPVPVFLRFGDSSLDFELRVFIRGIRDLIPVVHELNVAIDSEFRANGIEIAFPQRDIHFDSKPIEVRLVEANERD